MNKPLLLTAVISLAVLGAIFGYKVLAIRQQIAAHAAMVIPSTTVSAATVTRQTWANSLTAVGTLTSFQGTTLKTELEGLVQEVPAQSGASVIAGATLVVLDTASEEAQLRGLEAVAKLAEINLARAHELRANNTNTPNELDAAEATAAQARSAIDQLRVTLAKKHIGAPFSGRLGIVQVYPGQFLSKGEALVVLESIDPIHVDFSLPQQELARLREGQSVQLVVDAYPERLFAAKITAISPRIDGATRAIDIRATLANGDASLRPGMYARAEVMLPPTERALVLPSAAIIHNPYGESVFVIVDGTVQQRFVKTGPQRGDLVMIVDGLSDDEQVVTAGQLKLRNGASVRIDNSAAPDGTAAPKPSES